VDEPGPKTAEVVTALASAALMGIAVWYQMPPQERLWLRLQMAGFAHRLAGRLARAEGRFGMADELAGRDPSPRYGAAYGVSLCRDWLARSLADMRP
jgi:hypothetical protein